jgi:NAD(P)-dependent dehydrogenase (short-subunit alcohol dehydrogenase family)
MRRSEGKQSSGASWSYRPDARRNDVHCNICFIHSARTGTARPDCRRHRRQHWHRAGNARRAHAEGARIIFTARNLTRLEQAGRELDALRVAAFDASDPASLRSFFRELTVPIDHVMVTAGAPHYGPPLEMPVEEARHGLTDQLLLALELAPVRVNLIAAGFVDTALSASILDDGLDRRREELRTKAAHPACRWADRRRCASRTHHEQHSSHGCDVRHRWWPAARLLMNGRGKRTSTRIN